MKRRELGGPVDPRDLAGFGRCRHRLPPLVGLFSVFIALSAMSFTGAVVFASAALILRIDRSSRARRYSRPALSRGDDVAES